jgi:hypothetical protein
MKEEKGKEKGKEREKEKCFINTTRESCRQILA